MNIHKIEVVEYQQEYRQCVDWKGRNTAPCSACLLVLNCILNELSRNYAIHLHLIIRRNRVGIGVDNDIDE